MTRPTPVPAPTRPTPVPAPSAGAGRPVRAPVGAQYPSALVRALTVPAAFFATNWAAMLAILTVVGLGPALVAASRTTMDLRSHADRAFRETLRASAVLLRRDWVLSLALWAVLLLLAGNALILTDLATGSTRVFLVGISLPPTWLAVSALSAYVVVAASSDLTAPRGDIARRALALVVTRPMRALLAPVVIIGVVPLWLLAPLTIAIGFSLPPFFVARFWGRLDDEVPALPRASCPFSAGQPARRPCPSATELFLQHSAPLTHIMRIRDALPYRAYRHSGDACLEHLLQRSRRDMDSYKVGDGVRTKAGPMQYQYGTVVYLREDDGTYLVRFGGSQQMYFHADELEPWA